MNEPSNTGTDSTPEKFFVIEIDYMSSLERIDELLPAHRRWLDENFRAGTFLMSGPKDPRSGGLILARANSRSELDRLVAHDPFVHARAAVCRVIAFSPTKMAAAIDLPGGHESRP